MRDADGVETEKPVEYSKEKLPPCLHGSTCPKGTIHTAKQKELTPANQQCLRAFRRWRASGGNGGNGGNGGSGLGEVDELAADNFAILERIHREFEKRDDAKRLAVELGGILVRAMSS